MSRGQATIIASIFVVIVLAVLLIVALQILQIIRESAQISIHLSTEPFLKTATMANNSLKLDLVSGQKLVVTCTNMSSTEGTLTTRVYILNETQQEVPCLADYEYVVCTERSCLVLRTRPSHVQLHVDPMIKFYRDEVLHNVTSVVPMIPPLLYLSISHVVYTVDFLQSCKLNTTSHIVMTRLTEKHLKSGYVPLALSIATHITAPRREDMLVGNVTLYVTSNRSRGLVPCNFTLRSTRNAYSTSYINISSVAVFEKAEVVEQVDSLCRLRPLIEVEPVRIHVLWSPSRIEVTANRTTVKYTLLSRDMPTLWSSAKEYAYADECSIENFSGYFFGVSCSTQDTAYFNITLVWNFTAGNVDSLMRSLGVGIDTLSWVLLLSARGLGAVLNYTTYVVVYVRDVDAGEVSVLRYAPLNVYCVYILLPLPRCTVTIGGALQADLVSESRIEIVEVQFIGTLQAIAPTAGATSYVYLGVSNMGLVPTET